MTTFAPVPVARTASAATPAGSDAAVASRPLRRSVWPYAGLFAGLVGFAGTGLVNGPYPTEAEVDGGIEAVFTALGGATPMRIGSALGFLATYALLLFAVGYARHLKGRAPAGSLLPKFVQMALTAASGALFIGFGMKAAAAGGLSGGIDEAFYTHTDAVVINTLAGQMQYVGWQGVAVAMAATVVAALRYRMVPVWVGIIGAIFSVFVFAFTMVLALPYSAGLAAPVFLVVLVIGLLTSKASRN
jgi:hypothetical protein